MRKIDPVIVEYFKTRKPFSYAHLIRFERPIISSQELDVTDKEFVYLTDGSIDLYFNDPRVDPSPSNLATKYRANRVLDIPDITEHSQARATSIDLKLDANAIGAYLADLVNITGGGGTWEIEFTSINVYDKGLVEGDKITLETASNLYSLEILKFPADNKMRVSGDLVSGVHDVYIALTSQELVSILQDKTSDDYASFINREVQIYKVFFNSDDDRIGEPYYLYKGIIQDVSLEDTDGTINVNWSLSSHWGDFAEVRGRITSDESHRALDERGIPQPDSAIKKVYAYDKGFIHADTAVHIESTYTVQVEKQDVKYKKGFFGIGAKVKVKKYFVDEARQTELDFQLQGKTLDVIYGVRPAEGSPIFADTLKEDSSQIYVAYAISEGEIGGLYDVIIQDKSLICNNQADFDARAQQTEENTIDVICYGRSDRGDVLEGVQSTTTDTQDFYNTDYLQYFNEQNLSLLTNSNGFTQPLGLSSGSIGVLHENSIRVTEPINMTLSFYSGRSNQRAAPNLVNIAQSGGFKVQSDYWTGSNNMEYWGPNHRMLDTCYALANYTIAENETTIPSIKFIVKGKFVECYNYDYSYQHDFKALGESPDNFKLGDVVSIYNSNDVLIDSDIRIVKKFFIRDRNGYLEPRFEFNKEPDLGYIDGVPSITKFYMSNGINTWTMLTYNYVELEGSVSDSLMDPIMDVTPTPTPAPTPEVPNPVPGTIIDLSPTSKFKQAVEDGLIIDPRGYHKQTSIRLTNEKYYTDKF